MPPSRLESQSLAPYPSMSQAAQILGVAPSTLSRRPDVSCETRGYRDLALRPAEVLRLGRVYRKRSINEVAADLVALAKLAGAESQVENECDEFFEAEVRHAARR